jgi:hypothetical protein
MQKGSFKGGFSIAYEQIPNVIIHRQISDLPALFYQGNRLLNQDLSPLPIRMLKGII